MIVSTLTWDKVVVKYKDGRNESYKQAQVSFDNHMRSLRIYQSGNCDNFKDLLLAHAELIKLSPWAMQWKAYWWSSATPDMIEAEITCEF